MNAARGKVEREGRCRVCGLGPSHRLDAAHLVPRSLTRQGFDQEDLIVPLCSSAKGVRSGCHQAYDAHRLDLLPFLTVEEEVAVVRLLRALNPHGSGLAQGVRIVGGYVPGMVA